MLVRFNFLVELTTRLSEGRAGRDLTVCLVVSLALGLARTGFLTALTVGLEVGVVTVVLVLLVCSDLTDGLCDFLFSVEPGVIGTNIKPEVSC